MELLLFKSSMLSIKDGVVTLDWIHIEYTHRIVVIYMTHGEYIEYIDIDE